MDQKPSAGRIVFVTTTHRVCAHESIEENTVAVITSVNENGTVNVRTLPEVGDDRKLRDLVPYGTYPDKAVPGWRWPPRV